MNPSGHPAVKSECNLQRLDQFLESDHDRIEDAELVAHLDVCPACRTYLETHAGDAVLWRNASTLLKPSEFDLAGSQL